MIYTCPCCGYKTLSKEPPGTFEICIVCGWEDDNVQFRDPDYRGGANKESLREAQQNFIKTGVISEEARKVVKNSVVGIERDPKWVPLLKKFPAG